MTVGEAGLGQRPWVSWVCGQRQAGGRQGQRGRGGWQGGRGLRAELTDPHRFLSGSWFCARGLLPVYLSLLWHSRSVVSDSRDPMACGPPGSVSMGFPRQEYWSRLPLPFPGDLPSPGIEPESPTLAGKFFTTEPPGKSMHLLPRHLSCFR